MEEKIISECNCQNEIREDIASVVDEVILQTGRESDKVITILQEVQKRLNYLPSEALKQICLKSDITPGQLSGVATFYSQFRHIPAGRNIIKICTGTACHVKGSALIIDSFRRSLKIGETSCTSPDNLFSIEEVACLGCCTLAPVVQINEKTYGHVKPNQAEIIIKNFLNPAPGKVHSGSFETELKTEAEIRIGLGSCCVAGGSREILTEVERIKDKYQLNVKVRSVGCVGVCNQTPLLEIITKDKVHTRYTQVRKELVEEIILNQLIPGSIRKKIKHKINDWVDTFVSDDKINSPINLPDEIREKYLYNFLNDQVRIATDNSGILSPDSFDDYFLLDGFKALKHCLNNLNRIQIIDTIKESGLRGRGGGGFPTGQKWQISYDAKNSVKYIVCNGDEGDPGAFMDRMLLESFPFRVIEGMIIAGYAAEAAEGIFYIRAEYPLAVNRVKKCYKTMLQQRITWKRHSRFGFFL